MPPKETEYPVQINAAVKPQKNDLLWKGILEDVFEDFICFVNPAAARELDLQKGVQFLDKELEQVFPPEGDRYQPKVVDKLVKVFTFEGTEEWVLVHIEVQAKHSEDFGQRMFTYFYRIYDKYQKPITAYAILTEPSGKARSGNFNLSYQGTTLNYTFNVYKIAEQIEQELLASSNPFAFVVLTAKTALAGKTLRKEDRNKFLLQLKLDLAKELLSRDIPEKKVNALMNFLRFYVRISEPENNLIFDKQLEQLTERKSTMGIEELLLDIAKHEGKAEGRHQEALQIALELKKEGLAIDFIAKTTKLSPEEIKAL